MANIFTAAPAQRREFKPSSKSRKKRPAPWPSDVGDGEWNFAAPCLALIDEQSLQRCYSLREAFNALGWLARADAAWRRLHNDLPPWPVVYQQFRRWDEAGCFEAMVSDVRSIIRAVQGHQDQPSAVVLDGRTLHSACERGLRVGYEGCKKTQWQQSAHSCRYAGPLK